MIPLSLLTANFLACQNPDKGDEVVYPLDCLNPEVRSESTKPKELTEVPMVLHTFEDSGRSYFITHFDGAVENFSTDYMIDYNYSFWLEDEIIHDESCNPDDEDVDAQGIAEKFGSVPGAIDVYYCSNFPELGLGNMGLVLINSSTLYADYYHEMGHALGLLHTFEDKYGSELVDGSNSLVAGDFLSDTPADADCSYGSEPCYDPQGNPYNPDRNNIMSYYLESPLHFSDQQHQVMSCNLKEGSF